MTATQLIAAVASQVANALAVSPTSPDATSSDEVRSEYLSAFSAWSAGITSGEQICYALAGVIGVDLADGMSLGELAALT